MRARRRQLTNGSDVRVRWAHLGFPSSVTWLSGEASYREIADSAGSRVPLCSPSSLASGADILRYFCKTHLVCRLSFGSRKDSCSDQGQSWRNASAIVSSRSRVPLRRILANLWLTTRCVITRAVTVYLQSWPKCVGHFAFYSEFLQYSLPPLCDVGRLFSNCPFLTKNFAWGKGKVDLAHRTFFFHVKTIDGRGITLAARVSHIILARIAVPLGGYIHTFPWVQKGVRECTTPVRMTAH